MTPDALFQIGIPASSMTLYMESSAYFALEYVSLIFLLLFKET